jgi:hypothetical protein
LSPHSISSNFGTYVAAVLVHIDLDGDRPHPASLSALAAGRRVASSWGAALYAAVVVQDAPRTLDAEATAELATSSKLHGVDTIRAALARAGADKVVVALIDVPIAPLWSAVGGAWQTVLDQLRPRLVLFGADSPSAFELAPRTGARIGARLLVRARVSGGDTIELRDRDGVHARIDDSGAAVAMIGGRVAPLGEAGDDVEIVAIAIPSAGDPRVELAGVAPAEIAHATGAIVALGDDAANDANAVVDARRLAAALSATVVGSSAAVHALAPGAVVDAGTALAPELCVAIGDARVDLAGATSVVRVGGVAGKHVDGALAGPIAPVLAELTRRLERP